jgi:hypothetical protein
MPDNAGRSHAALFDQFGDEHAIADWGGDDLFTRMPRPRAVDTAPPPRFRPSLVTGDPDTTSGAEPRDADAHADQAETLAGEPRLALVDPPAAPERDTGRHRQASADADADADARMRARADRLGLRIVEIDEAAPARRFDASGELIMPARGRRTKVITGHPGGAARPLPMVPAERRRPQRTVAEWAAPQPERLVAWAFPLGLVLIVVAILTAGS